MKLTIQRPTNSSEKSNLILSSSDAYAINDFYGYNDHFINLLLVRNDTTNNVDVYLKQAKWDKITTDLTSSFTASASVEYPKKWLTGNTLRIGSDDSLNRFTVQEIRYWNKLISDDILNEHVLSPHSYNSNNPTGSFYDLSLRLPMIDKFDIAVTTSLLSEHPDYSENTLNDGTVLTGTFNSFVETSFEGINETHYVINPSIGNRSIFSDRIVIDNVTSSYDHTVLDKKISTENTRTNLNNSNNNRLGIYFSPQNIINEDIFKHAGYFRLDDYIGDPESLYKSSYPNLRFFANEYWKKYQNTNTTSDYLRLFKLYDFSIFSQINQAIPERANKILGLLIEPNILERSKVKSLPPSKELNIFDIDIEKGILYTISGSNVGPIDVEVDYDPNDDIEATYNQYSITINDYKNYYSGSRYIVHDLLFTTSSGDLVISEGISTVQFLQTSVSESFDSKYKETTEYFYSSSLHAYTQRYYSSSFIAAKVQDYLPISLYNLKYGGCTLTSTDVNIANSDIYQNKPVVEVIINDSGELISSEYDSDGNFDVV